MLKNFFRYLEISGQTVLFVFQTKLELMKFKALLFAFVAISLTSCSGDDSNPVDNNPDPIVEKDIAKIVILSEGDTSAVFNYENNMLKERFLYLDGQMWHEDFYDYNEEGLRVGRTVYEYGELGFTESIEYDDSNRIERIRQEIPNALLVTVMTFDYSLTDKIIMNVTEYNWDDITYDESIFDLDETGRIYKITSDSDIKEAVYSGNNITQIIKTNGESSGVDTYVFDMETDVKGSFLEINYNQFGTNMNNHIVHNSEFAPEIDKLVIDETWQWNDEITTIGYEYEFDEDGFPVKQMIYQEGFPPAELIIIYQ